jgi:hypothetical protein
VIALYLRSTDEAKRAFRVASIRYVARMLRGEGFDESAIWLEARATRLLGAMPPACEVFAPDGAP